MKIQVIDSLTRFLELRDAWIALCERGGHSLPFDSHRWHSAWWASLAAEPGKGDARVLTAWAGDDLVAALPIFYSRARFRRLPARQCSVLGGNWGTVSVLACPRLREQAIPAIVDAMVARGMPDWQLFRAFPLQKDDSAAMLYAALEKRSRRSRCAVRSQPYLALSGDWENFLATKSKNFRRTIKRKNRALEDAGLTVAIRTNPSASEIRSVVGTVSQKSWQGLCGQAVAATAFGQRFYDHLAEGRGEFSVHLASVQKGDEPIAYLLGLVCNGTYHAFDTGFDPLWSEQSPGLVLHFSALEASHALGLSEFDFGYDAQYKDRFEPQQRELLDVVSIRSGSLAVLDLAAEWLAPVRRVFN